MELLFIQIVIIFSMKIQNINYSLKNNKRVLSAQVILRSGKTHDIYFEVDNKHIDLIAKDASPFLAAALPIAMKKNEAIEIEGSTSKALMANTPKIMKILQSWDLGFDPVSISANVLTKYFKKSKNVGCFFSGGVDSFYTYLKNKNKIDTLIFVHGFDIKVADVKLYNKIEKNIIKIAKKENIKLIKVKTNIREVFEQYFDWDMSHEFALASVSLFLRNGFKEIFMSCGQTDNNAVHHYMSPELDVLWSTEKMKIHHFGCFAGKISKLAYLSHSPLVMRNLRVCWVNKKKEYNCCECEKCFRNMLALYVSDSLEKCVTFKKKLDLDKLESIRINEYVLKYFIAVLKALDQKNDRSKVRFALERCIENNTFPKFQQRLYRNSRDFIRYFDKKYNRNRLYWFMAQRDLIK